MKQLCVLKKPLRVTFKLQTNIRRRFTENVGICFPSKLASFTRPVPLLTALKKCEFVTNFEISANIASLIHHVAAHVAGLRSALTSYKITA